jgi:CRISPR-associated protein Cas5h
MIISIDLKADFGFLKKPDTNDPVYLTFNMLHKPALLGIIGAILGLSGFKTKDKTPQYYQILEGLQIGIKPLSDDKGNFEKTLIRYNNSVGYANEDGGNLIVTEQTLIRPSYRCFILVNEVENGMGNKLYTMLKEKQAEYLPYLGKNDFSLWWDNFQQYQYSPFEPTASFKLSSIFIKEEALKEGKKTTLSFLPVAGKSGNSFLYFENLPVSYNTDLMQYEYKPFGYTDWDLKQNYEVENLYRLDNHEIIQLF